MLCKHSQSLPHTPRLDFEHNSTIHSTSTIEYDLILLPAADMPTNILTLPPELRIMICEEILPDITISAKFVCMSISYRHTNADKPTSTKSKLSKKYWEERGWFWCYSLASRIYGGGG